MSKVDQLILILGDQLSHSISSLAGAGKSTTHVLMCEVADEATYVRHHKKKIAFLFSAMRHFAGELRQSGWHVTYVKLDDPGNSGSFTGEVGRAIKSLGVDRIIVTEPGEWRVLDCIQSWPELFGCTVDVIADGRFIADHKTFDEWAANRRQLRMEFFYREMRRTTGLLMRDGEPEGGQWNFDHDNRKPALSDLFMPEVSRFEPDAMTREVLDLVARRFGGHIGELEPFWFAVTRDQALVALDHFITTALPSFGTFQDAMLRDQRFLYHSVLSGYINAGLLDAREVCAAAETAYREGRAPLNSVEGFIRQIIGWREYMRGIYWRHGRGYSRQNFLHATRPLPGFYWTGETDMACLSAAIGQTIEEAYAHHIQRLMVTGNFAMLAGVDPHEVHEWYLAVYIDAYEWVEAPNTIGMSQFADGGLLGSKPYAASGNYINKMSDYCRGCQYDVKKRVGPDACPFNALYWHFMDRNRDKLGQVQRLRQVYATWDKMNDKDRASALSSAETFLASLN